MWSIGTQGKLISPIPDNEPLPKDEYFFFGILRGSGSMYKRCQKLGYDFFYADHAYFYNEKFKKMSCFRVTKNNHANTKIINCNSDRYEKFKSQELKQWHSNNGKKILILPLIIIFLYLEMISRGYQKQSILLNKILIEKF